MVAEAQSTATVYVSETGNNLRPYKIFTPAATMLEICRDLGANDAGKTRNTLAKELERQYSGANPETDTETIVSVNVSKKDHEAIVETIARLGLDTGPVPEGFEKSLPEPETPRRPNAKKQPRECGCGCGGTTGGGTYLPGHDMKLRSRLIKSVDKEGDKSAADLLVEHNWWTQAESEARVEKFNAKSVAASNKPANVEQSEEELDLPGEDG